MADHPQPTVKIHTPLLQAIRAGLKIILDDGQPTDKFLLTISRNRKFGSRDRRFIASNLYDIIRYKLLFENVYKKHPLKGMPAYHAYVIMNHLRTGIAISNIDTVMNGNTEIIKTWQTAIEALINPDNIKDLNERITLSFPQWMWDIGLSEYASSWPDIARSLNDPAVTYVRANRLKISQEELHNQLLGIEVDNNMIDGTDALELITRKKLSNHPLYKKGYFEFQDLASQQVALMSEIEDDMIVIDTCAGAGGKTLHLAALMHNTGHLVVTDKFSKRLNQLEFRASRNGVSNLEIIGHKDLDEWNEKADRVILDVPCTATGTIWRKPEIKWRLRESDLKKYTGIQAEIIEHGARLVKDGGKLIYATCSIFKSEGESIVNNFLENKPGFKLAHQRRFFSHEDRTDGFYIAVLSKSVTV